MTETNLQNCDREISPRGVLKAMPKIELHAHLNGSLSKATLNKLYKVKYGKPCIPEKYMHSGCDFSSDSLSKCFDIFKLVHDISQSPSAIRMATEDVISDFYNDGVCYLELRSTPKNIPGSMTQSSYVDAMLSAVEHMKHSLPDIVVKLLLSINRESSVQLAQETLKIAESNFHSSSSTIVGFDLSGNPNVGDVKDFIPIFQRAKQIGLKLSLHMAEIPNADEEVSKLLNLQPDRIGHGTFIHPKKGGCEKNYAEVQRQKIPLELCLSSNVISKTVSSYNDHHLPLWREIGHPYMLCTDDKGVFNTSLTEEYHLANKHLSLTVEELRKMSYDSIEYSFASFSEKHELRDLWKKRKSQEKFHVN